MIQPRAVFGLAAAAVAVATAISAPGCSKSGGRVTEPGVWTRPLGFPAGASAPLPNTPVNLVRRLEWCWNHRALDEYRDLFSEDFVFACSPEDSAGSSGGDGLFRREDELTVAAHLFRGDPRGLPPARRVRLALDRTLNVLPDPRAGKPGLVHREISTRFDLTIETEVSDYRVTGALRFFAVRGDSALLPLELRDRGFTPDSTRWYVERWEDRSIPNPGAASDADRRGRIAATSGRTITLCAVKSRYR